ncbi:hypothetical protein FRC08_007342 [Ceratobasidium sp. 394]|nr:hypothetical protein FRC08_007342 [Ceratobasidium sp. 394]
MYPRGKKRKLEPAASAPSADADRKQLRSLLKRCDKAKIVKALADHLDYASSQEIKSLKSLLSKELACLEPELHCVRCHETYLESRNGPEECQIPHSDTEGVAQDEEDELWGGFACCGEDFDEKDVICVFARHTTDKGMVIYYGDEPVDEDDEYFAQNENVKRCEAIGCNVG